MTSHLTLGLFGHLICSVFFCQLIKSQEEMEVFFVFPPVPVTLFQAFGLHFVMEGVKRKMSPLHFLRFGDAQNLELFYPI